MADNSHRQLEEYLIEGLKGVELSVIARRRGVSRQAIYQLLHKRLKKRFAEQYQQLKEKYQIERNLPLWVLRVEHAMFMEAGEKHVRSKRSLPQRDNQGRTIDQSRREKKFVRSEFHSAADVSV